MTDQQTLTQLAARLETAEKALQETQAKGRRDRRLVAGALGLGAAMFLMGQSAPHKKSVSAETFALVNAEGKLRGGMGTVKSGTGSMFLMDAEGNKRIHMTVAKTGTPAISLLGPDGKVRMSFGVAKDGMSFLAQKGPNGKIRNFLFTDANGRANYRQKDGEGKNVVAMPKTKKKKK